MVVCDGCKKPAEEKETLMRVSVTATCGINATGDLCKKCQKALKAKIESFGFAPEPTEAASLGAGPSKA